MAKAISPEDFTTTRSNAPSRANDSRYAPRRTQIMKGLVSGSKEAQE